MRHPNGQSPAVHSRAFPLPQWFRHLIPSVAPTFRFAKNGVAMLAFIAASLGMSGYGFYRSLRPKIVEKTVTVTVEKVVKPECPKTDSHRQKSGTKKANTDTVAAPAQQPSLSLDCGGGNCAQSS